MALPSTGSISMSQVNVELKKSETQQISLNDSDVRKLAGKASGTISMGDLRGKKTSESVVDYQIYSNSWSGRSQTGSFTINFPHKVISGTISVKSGSRSGQVMPAYTVILGKKCGSSATLISVPKDTKSINCTYQTGYDRNQNGNTINGTCICDIKFTGEWEL